jgi:hypothetical protein
VLESYQPPERWVKMLIPEPRMQVARINALAQFLKEASSPAPPWAATSD